MEQSNPKMNPSTWDFPDLDKGSRVYQIQRSMLHHDYMVTSPNGEQVLHADNSSFTPGKPDLTFHRGADDQAPVVSVCKFAHFSRHFKVGLGDPQSPNAVEWGDVECQNWRQTKYALQMPLDAGNGMKVHGFLWKQSSLGDDAHIIDDRTGATVAVFNSASFSLRKVGTLGIQVNYGRDFELMVLTTGIALFEKQRRAKTAAVAGGGGGGGGGGGC